MKNLICIVGPRGAGKETLLNYILYVFQEITLSRVVPFTTRDKRSNETDGKEYFFFKPENFSTLLQNEILYKVLIGNSSDKTHYYSGTLKSEFNRHENGIIDITAEGARILSRYAQRSLLLYVYASPEERCKRIMARQNISENAALQLMSNEPSPGTETTIDKLYPEFSIVHNYDEGLIKAQTYVSEIVSEFFKSHKVSFAY